MVNRQFLVIECITAILALIQITQVQIGTAKAHVPLAVKVLFGHCHSWIVDR
jgi:hypothetical protein